MNKILLLFLLIVLSANAYAQSDSIQNWKEEFNKYFKENLEHEYVTSLFTKGKRLKWYKYFKYKNEYILIYENNTDTFRIITFKNDVLFKYIDEEERYIRAYNNKLFDLKKLRAKFSDTSVVTNQIGIRYSSIFCGHFLPANKEEINNIKNKKAKEGQIFINSIAQFFEDKFK